MELSKRDALEKTQKMWLWLAGNYGKKKADYFECQKISPAPRANCYLCEFMSGTRGSCRGKCIVDWSKPLNPPGTTSYCFCGREYQLYHKEYDNQNFGIASTHAHEIAKLAEDALKKLDEEEKDCTHGRISDSVTYDAKNTETTAYMREDIYEKMLEVIKWAAKIKTYEIPRTARELCKELGL